MWQEPVVRAACKKQFEYCFLPLDAERSGAVSPQRYWKRRFICRCGEMVDAHASGACEETHGGSSPFIGIFFRRPCSNELFTPVVPAGQRRFTRSSILPRKAHSSPTVQAESLHRQIFL